MAYFYKLFWTQSKGLNKSSKILTTHLIFDVAVAADSPQVFQGPPQENDKETPEERHHG